MYPLVVLLVCLGGAFAGRFSDDFDVGSVLVTDNMWDNILERVDRYILAPLPYWYDELDPHVTETMLTDHFTGEMNLMKSAMNYHLMKWREEEPDHEMVNKSILYIMQNLEKVPEKYMMELRFFGGGYMNHCFYFGLLSPNEDGVDRAPTGALLDEINLNFGSLEKLKEEFTAAVKTIRGSGWVWLTRLPGVTGDTSMRVQTSSNHDSPILSGMWPILAMDMWEHAYYLKHSYKKWDAITDFWMVLDWDRVARLDQWWHNLDEEQVKADERVDKLVVNLEKQAAARKNPKSEDKSEL